MLSAQTYHSPLGEMLLVCDEAGLTGVWFADQKYFPQNLSCEFSSHPILSQTGRWLDDYFRGVTPLSLPPLHLVGSEFRLQVWTSLLEIPYGSLVSYSDIAKRLAVRRGVSSLSSQAVGGAVGHNPISIIVPCHRVVGADGSLTGYAGGLRRKEYLLALERSNVCVNQ